MVRDPSNFGFAGFAIGFILLEEFEFISLILESVIEFCSMTPISTISHLNNPLIEALFMLINVIVIIIVAIVIRIVNFILQNSFYEDVMITAFMKK